MAEPPAASILSLAEAENLCNIRPVCEGEVMQHIGEKRYASLRRRIIGVLYQVIVQVKTARNVLQLYHLHLAET